MLITIGIVMLKIAIKRAESQARLDSPEREQFGAKLNVQYSMFNVQCSTFNVQCSQKAAPLSKGSCQLAD